ncbi:MAG: helix-turn-helix domain-containing protein [Gammaproteobacteria bacterium]
MWMTAIVLANYADAEGHNIFPAVATVAKKTHQTERTVQRQLRRIEKSGWLILEENEHGGRHKSRRYPINLEWLKGDTAVSPDPSSNRPQHAQRTP